MEGEFNKPMEKVFIEHDIRSIREAEKEAFTLYAPIFKLYGDKFSWYAVKLVASIERQNASPYRAFVVCKIIDNTGHIVESKDHDMFMDFAWPLAFSANGYVSVYVDVNDDAVALLQACEEYFQHPF